MKGSDKEEKVTKQKEGKLLYSLMRALLPVWESLVMLGPDLGRKSGGREGGRDRDETKEGDRRTDKDAAATGNVNLRLFLLERGHGLMNHRFLRHDKRR